MNTLKMICKIPGSKTVLQKFFTPPPSPVTAFGIRFKNPVGLAAGFDKNGKYLKELTALGFGFIEIGTVTPLPQEGNPRPRLFRLSKDKAIINRMGFNNDGMMTVAERLKEFRSNTPDIVIGGNIGKNKITPNEEAWQDYEKCFLTLYDFVDYFVVNVSSPNTPGLRDLQQRDSLHKILTHLQNLRTRFAHKKPILLKIAPDLNEADLAGIIDLADEIKLDGLVVSNTTISRDGCTTSPAQIKKIGAGGLSGAPLSVKSNEVLQQIHHRLRDMPIIGSGGIMTAADARAKTAAGAALLQVYTGFIYHGPSIIKNISKVVS